MKIIKKGTPCFVTQLGHNNFYYPIYNDEGLTCFEEDVEDFEIKSWLCPHSSLKAIYVDVTSIKDLYGSTKTIVWIEKKHLKDA